MDNLARKLEFPREISEEVGTVRRAEGGGFLVHTDRGDYRARRAASCLIEPSEGDYVLLSVVPRGVYVLAVLESEDSAQTTMAIEGDLNIQLRSGRFAVAAQEGV